MRPLLKSAWLDTALGPMLAISDEESLNLLEFVDRHGLEREIERLRIRCKVAIVPGMASPIESTKEELDKYFKGELNVFQTPLKLLGSEFQKNAWQALVEVPYGQTRSYMQQAEFIGNPKAFRAVANANGANQIAIMIPCHRIIKTNGEVGGYGGGLARKKWLIEHERKYSKTH